MQHLEVKAAATTTDKGQFSAIAAAYTLDRVGDEIVPGAFQKTIAAWQTSGKRITLHWDHRGDPEDIIGTVDPSSMRETKDGLYVEGQLDLKGSSQAREAWRSMKADALSLSFGYLATKTKQRGKVKQLLEIDLYEISIVPAPANADTRVLSLKSALDEETSSQDQAVEDGHDEEPERVKSAPQDPLRKRSEELALALASEGLPPGRYQEPQPEPEPVPLDERELRRRSDAVRLRIAGG